MACSDIQISQGRWLIKAAMILPKPKLTRMIGNAQHKSVDIDATKPEIRNNGLNFFIRSTYLSL